VQQRWPESIFRTPTPLVFQNFWIRVRKRIRLFFKFENPTPVQTPATIIDPTIIYQCFYLRNDRTDSCYCRNGNVTQDPGPFFHKFLTQGPDPKEKRGILPESTPAIRIRSHLWSARPDDANQFGANSSCSARVFIEKQAGEYMTPSLSEERIWSWKGPAPCVCTCGARSKHFIEDNVNLVVLFS